jgi:hypothetical protein
MPSLEAAGRFLQANAAAYGGNSHNHLKIMMFSSKMSAGGRWCRTENRPKARIDLQGAQLRAWRDGMRINRALAFVVLVAALGSAGTANAQRCTRQGNDVSCDDGRRGVLEGDSIRWPDGTRSSSSPHPSVIIGNKSSVHIGPGVFVGKGNGMVPMDDPNAPNKTRCAVVDEVSYCY